MGRYIPQLDGVRAVAILLVIGAHTGYIPGGYVGVDVFFALSGYLITAILLREYRMGRWSLKWFYVRRARRLYPALLVLLLVCVPFGALLARSEGHYLVLAAFAGSYLMDWAHEVNSNWVGLGLGHTWSLAVEEQFYLLWPPFLLFSLRRATRRWIVASTLAFAAIALGGLVVRGSLAANAMYLPTGRGGVLLLGCALAVALERRRCAHAEAVAGVGALGLAVTVALAGDKLHGGVWASSTGLFATMLIAGIVEGGMIARALAVKPLTWLGERSYGIYLWHGVIAFALQQTTAPSHPMLRALAPTLFGSVMLAALSYRYIEAPLRRSRSWPADTLSARAWAVPAFRWPAERAAARYVARRRRPGEPTGARDAGQDAYPFP